MGFPLRPLAFVDEVGALGLVDFVRSPILTAPAAPTPERVTPSSGESSPSSLPPTRQRHTSSSAIPRAKNTTKTTYLSSGTLTRKEMRTPSPNHQRDRSASGYRLGGVQQNVDGARTATSGSNMRRGAGSRSRLFSGGGEEGSIGATNSPIRKFSTPCAQRGGQDIVGLEGTNYGFMVASISHRC